MSGLFSFLLSLGEKRARGEEEASRFGRERLELIIFPPSCSYTSPHNVKLSRSYEGEFSISSQELGRDTRG